MGAQVRSRGVTPKRVDLEDLIHARQVADLLGLAGPTTVSAYRTARLKDGTLRYPDFPEPVLPTDRTEAPQPGVGLYWLRRDILKWRAKHPAIGRNREPRDAEPDPS